MKYLLFIFGFWLSVPLFAQNDRPTVFETSKGAETGTYEDIINYYKSLSSRSPVVEMKEMGQTDSGKPLHLVILDTDKDFDFEKSREKGKTVILINNGIHPGEPDGIEASQMLLRNYAMNIKKQEVLQNMVIAVIPVYNIGGALNRNGHSRANQNGPNAYGFRGNAQGYDLNRDFIKADSRNTKAFYEIFHMVNPDIFIDTHVSNGADYQYSITHVATQHNKIGGNMGDYINKEFTPQLEKIIAAKGSEITPYVNVFNNTPDAEGIIQFMDYPRYSTGYAALFNTLGFMVETHMLKPFDVRVEATYNFIESIMEIAGKEGKRIQEMHHTTALKPGDQHPLSWKLDRSEYQDIKFKGYEGEMVQSKVTGQQRLFYNREKPFTKNISFYNNYVPLKEVVVPIAYLIPQGWHQVVDRLKSNNVAYSRLEKDTTINVESYGIEKYNTSSSPYEGHYTHNNVKLTTETKLISFRAGDYIFNTNQPSGRYLIEVLEPEGADSFFSWNFFDTILQQKEHFSPYVFEEVAGTLLQENTELKQAFEQRKKNDKEFANNWYAQLDFIYKHSPYHEQAYMQYPVYRLVD